MRDIALLARCEPLHGGITDLEGACVKCLKDCFPNTRIFLCADLHPGSQLPLEWKFFGAASKESLRLTSLSTLAENLRLQLRIMRKERVNLDKPVRHNTAPHTVRTCSSCAWWRAGGVAASPAITAATAITAAITAAIAATAITAITATTATTTAATAATAATAVTATTATTAAATAATASGFLIVEDTAVVLLFQVQTYSKPLLRCPTGQFFPSVLVKISWWQMHLKEGRGGAAVGHGNHKDCRLICDREEDDAHCAEPPHFAIYGYIASCRRFVCLREKVVRQHRPGWDGRQSILILLHYTR